MNLITDTIELVDGTIEEEINEASGNTEKNYYISGIFSTPDTKNRNGRIYPRAIWEAEVARYQDEIKNRTVNTLSEYQHPPRSTVDPIKAVGRVVEFNFKEDGNIHGKIKILNDNTDITNKLKGLIKEGIKIGVSTRGIGKVSATGVVEKYKLITTDIVDMPSDYNSMLDGIVEGVEFINGIAQDKEYTLDDNGCIGEVCSIVKSEEITEKTEETKEPCKIAKKIEEEIGKLEERVYSKLKEELTKEEITEEVNKTEDLLKEAFETLYSKLKKD